jgi:hypothetical protein
MQQSKRWIQAFWDVFTLAFAVKIFNRKGRKDVRKGRKEIRRILAI